MASRIVPAVRGRDRFRVNGVWTAGGKPIAGWTGPHNEYAFGFDVNIAIGLFTRRPVPR